MRSLLKRPLRPKTSDEGVALVLTLLIISMLVVVVVGFTSVSRLEQVAARNATYQATAEQMAHLATGQAIAQLREAIQAGVQARVYSSQSGMIHLFNQPSVPLFSQGGTDNTNINSLTSDGFVTANPGDNVVVAMQTVASGASSVGRFGFYVADETTKLPINFAAPPRSVLNPVTPRPFSIKGVGTNVANDVVSSLSNILTRNFSNNTISNWSYFFTQEQVGDAVSGIGQVFSRRLSVATETNPFWGGRTAWLTPKVRVNELGVNDAGLAALTDAVTDTNLTRVFGQHFGDKYGVGTTRQLLANMLQLRTPYWSTNYLNSQAFGTVLTNVPVIGAGSLPPGSPPPPAPDAGMAKKTFGIPENVLGYTPFPMLAEVAVGGLEYGFSGSATSDPNMSIRFFVVCKLFNPFPSEYRGGGQIYVQIDKARFRMTNANPSTATGDRFQQVWRGPDGTHRALAPGYNDMPESGSGAWDPWGLLTGVVGPNLERTEPQIPPIAPGTPAFSPPLRALQPANGVQVVSIPDISAASTTNIAIPFTIQSSARDESTGLYTGPDAAMYIIVDQVRLLASGNAASLRDWCSGPDFRAALGQSATAQFILPVQGIPRSGSFTNGGYVPSSFPADLSPNRWVSIAKLDPRMKRGYADVESPMAWLTNVSTLRSNGLAFGPANFRTNQIPADLAFSNNPAMAAFNTNLPPILNSTNLNYSMAADLGKVFTGLPWRTLRMQPQPTNESTARLIPDWALLEVLDYSPPPRALTPVSPNINYAHLGTVGASSFGAGLRSQLDVLTNTNTGLTLADPATGAAIPNVPGLRTAGTNLAGISAMVGNLTSLTNPARWAGGSGGWFASRTNLGFPAGALLLPSEVTEVRGFADYQTNADLFKANELRLAALFPGLSTKSRFFTIYALGEAMQGTDAIATSLLQTLVEVDDSATPVSVRIKLQSQSTE